MFGSMILHRIQAARTKGRYLFVAILDLVKAIQFAEKILVLVRAYLEEIQLCFNTSNCTTSWQHLEVGIMVTMTMEVIIRAVSGDRPQDGTRLLPIQAYMDVMTTLTTTAPCTHWLLAKLNDSLKSGTGGKVPH